MILRTISSAKSRPSSIHVKFHLIPFLCLSVVLHIAQQTVSRNRKPDITHPFLIALPRSVLKIQNRHKLCDINHSYQLVREAIGLHDSPQSFAIIIGTKSFSRSTKCTYNVACHSLTCSMMLWRMTILSIVLSLFRNPACSFQLSTWCTPFCILSMMTLLITLLATGNNVMPRQFLHSFTRISSI